MNYNFPIYFFDPPIVLDTSVTPIPGSGDEPLQVVLDSGFKSVIGLDYIDTTGDFIGVYLGSIDNLKLLCVIGNGLSTRAWGVIGAHNRISLRSMTSSAITNGKLQASFMSY